MPPRDWKFRIKDILKAIDAIQEYTKGMGFRTFTGDRRTVDAVVRNLTIIGEAAVQIPEDLCLKHSEIPWYEMRGMRNLVVHEYFQADDAVVWNTVKMDLPSLPAHFEKILEED